MSPDVHSRVLATMGGIAILALSGYTENTGISAPARPDRMPTPRRVSISNNANASFPGDRLYKAIHGVTVDVSDATGSFTSSREFQHMDTAPPEQSEAVRLSRAYESFVKAQIPLEADIAANLAANISSLYWR